MNLLDIPTTPTPPTETQSETPPSITLQYPIPSNQWPRLAPRHTINNAQRDSEGRTEFPLREGAPPDISDTDTNSITADLSPTSSQFGFSPAVWTPIQSPTPGSPPPYTKIPTTAEDSDDEDDMPEPVPIFTGKPGEQDPQDFMNRLETSILMKSSMTEATKVRLLQLALKAKSPADEWFRTLTSADKATFATAQAAFEDRWPTKPITKKTTAERQAILDGTILMPSQLCRRVAANIGAEEELSHVVWADKVERMAAEIPDSNNLLVAATRKKLPWPIMKLVSMKPMTWKEFTDTVRAITVEEIMEKMEEERDLKRYQPATPPTPSKSLGAAFQNMGIAPQIQRQPSNPTVPYQAQRNQQTQRNTFNSASDRPAHERLDDVINKALPMHPNNAEGIALYNMQVATWQTTHGPSGRGPSEVRPYPLTPGTAPAASGECWNCGQRNHHPSPCIAPRVPIYESKWRSIAQTVRKKAEIAAAGPITDVNVVLAADEVQAYDDDDLAHLLNIINQGKAEGPST